MIMTRIWLFEGVGLSHDYSNLDFGFELIFISILLNGLLLFKKAPMNIHSTPWWGLPLMKIPFMTNFVVNIALVLSQIGMTVKEFTNVY